MNKKLIIPLIVTLFAIIISAFYFALVRPEITNILQGKGPQWLSNILHNMYPRLLVESQRFDQAFFLNKGDQVIVRLWLVISILNFILIGRLYSERLKSMWEYFWSVKLSRTAVNSLISVYSFFLLIHIYDWYFELVSYGSLSAFYKPIGFYKFLAPSFPGPEVILILNILLVVAALLSMFRVKVEWSVPIMIVLFIFEQGLFYCFEKMDHGYATFTYAGIALIFLSIERKKAPTNIPSWPVHLAMVLIAFSYFQSGTEKMLNSGFSWMDSGTLMSYLQAHPTNSGAWLMEQKVLVAILPFLILIFQLTFPLTLFKRRLIPYYLIFGVSFHWGSTLFMGISAYHSPWILAYVFFLDWELISSRLSVLFKKKAMDRNHYQSE